MFYILYKGGETMENVLDVASYIYNKYQSTYGEQISEMKLQKLLYFTQRESFIQNNRPLFDAVFYAWKYGPVLKEVRTAYQQGTLGAIVLSPEVTCRIAPVADYVFSSLGNNDAWSLSRLSHGEFSWKNARGGLSEYENGDNPMKNEDIMQDAIRIRERRNILNGLGLL